MLSKFEAVVVFASNSPSFALSLNLSLPGPVLLEFCLTAYHQEISFDLGLLAAGVIGGLPCEIGSVGPKGLGVGGRHPGRLALNWSVEGQQHLFGLQKLFWLVIPLLLVLLLAV
jgi:hypothetical protein